MLMSVLYMKNSNASLIKIRQQNFMMQSETHYVVLPAIQQHADADKKTLLI